MGRKQYTAEMMESSSWYHTLSIYTTENLIPCSSSSSFSSSSRVTEFTRMHPHTRIFYIFLHQYHCIFLPKSILKSPFRSPPSITYPPSPQSKVLIHSSATDYHGNLTEPPEKRTCRTDTNTLSTPTRSYTLHLPRDTCRRSQCSPVYCRMYTRCRMRLLRGDRCGRLRGRA
jgi:hypothetical protein